MKGGIFIYIPWSIHKKVTKKLNVLFFWKEKIPVDLKFGMIIRIEQTMCLAWWITIIDIAFHELDLRTLKQLPRTLIFHMFWILDPIVWRYLNFVLREQCVLFVNAEYFLATIEASLLVEILNLHLFHTLQHMNIVWQI